MLGHMVSAALLDQGLDALPLPGKARAAKVTVVRGLPVDRPGHSCIVESDFYPELTTWIEEFVREYRATAGSPEMVVDPAKARLGSGKNEL